ncbi:MAG TPA: MarR family transcriptional regulator [Gemmatimonadaceae bacterium]|nr:MarR family transcriptional regulator [Gemmatimonadaceae bacterium]
MGRSGPDGGTLSAVLEAAERLQARLETALVEVGLSISKFDAMDQLMMADDPLTLGELAARLQCVRSNITQLVDRLESEGLVKRGSCSEDRRAVRAMVTPVGRERHAAGVTAIRAVQAELAGKLGVDDRERLVRLLGAAVG